MKNYIYKCASLELTLEPTYASDGSIKYANVLIANVYLGFITRHQASEDYPADWLVYRTNGKYIGDASDMDEALKMLLADILARS